MVDFICIVDLPWPDKILSPNAREHWRPVWKAKKKAKTDAFYCAMAAGKPKNIPAGDIHLDVVFYPPTNRTRDEDNMMARMKAALDGLAEAWGVNDSRFRCKPMFSRAVPNGAVKIFLKKRLDHELQNCNSDLAKGNPDGLCSLGCSKLEEDKEGPAHPVLRGANTDD